jgi:alpha-glucosidase
MVGQEWWRTGVVYQVYPRSFQDSNGDGVGDLPGLIARLDHLVRLGVDAVWVSPFYPSPMKDFGYDVADYCGVDPLFGTMADFDALVEATHARGLKLIVDFVPNHSSDQHPWFIESRSSRGAPKRDWYIWRDPAPDGGPPTNWLSVFGGGAWTLDEASGQYYLHSFLASQPDLNWRNPAVEAALYDAMRFWLDRGVDGFRVDAVWHLIKDDQFRDNPPNPDYVEGLSAPHTTLAPIYSAGRPETLEYVRRMRAVLDAYPGDRLLIAEVYLPIVELVTYYGQDGDGSQLPFNFKLIQNAWTAAAVDDVVTRYEAALPPGAQPNWVMGNHDVMRVASRIGVANVPAAAVLLTTLRGTPTIYYGEELGMSDTPIPPERLQDPRAFSQPELGRDPARTPMLWSDEPNAGFSTAEPWLPLAPDWRVINAETETGDPNSTFALYRRLLALRRAEPALHAGRWSPLGVQGNVLGFVRENGGTRFAVVINFGPEATTFDGVIGTVAISTVRARDGATVDGVDLAPHEAMVVRL